MRYCSSISVSQLAQLGAWLTSLENELRLRDFALVPPGVWIAQVNNSSFKVYDNKNCLKIYMSVIGIKHFRIFFDDSEHFSCYWQHTCSHSSRLTVIVVHYDTLSRTCLVYLTPLHTIVLPRDFRQWTTSSLSAGCCCVWERAVGWDRMSVDRVSSVIILCCLVWYCFCLFCYAIYLLLLISESCYFVSSGLSFSFLHGHFVTYTTVITVCSYMASTEVCVLHFWLSFPVSYCFFLIRSICVLFHGLQFVLFWTKIQLQSKFQQCKYLLPD